MVMSWPLRIATLSKGGFSIARFMAAQADGFWYDFGLVSSLSQDTAGATPVTAFGDVIGRVVDRRTGANSPRNATQATASLKPKYQATGGAFDGSDDNLLSTFSAGVGANFLIAKATIPASVPSTQTMIGAAGAGVDRFRLEINSAGQLQWGVGSLVTSVAGDLRGQTITAGLTMDGTNLAVFLGASQVHSGAQSGVPTTARPVRIGANNADGFASQFFAGSIKAALGGRQFLDLTTFKKIAAAL